MDERIFEKLIKESYYLRKHGAGFGGILYTALSSVGFQRIDNIDEFIEKFKPDMLLLKSMENDVEVEIYRSNLEGYRVDKTKRSLCIKLKDSPGLEIKF